MLKPIRMPDDTEVTVGSDSPIVVCESCLKSNPSHLMINVVICVPSAGRVDKQGFGCQEHWSCSTDCFVKVAHACIDEHVTALLKFHRGE